MPTTQTPAADTLGDVVRDALEGTSLRQVSEATGIPLATLSRRVNGLTHFQTAELERVAAFLGTTPSRLMASAEERAA